MGKVSSLPQEEGGVLEPEMGPWGRDAVQTVLALSVLFGCQSASLCQSLTNLLLLFLTGVTAAPVATSLCLVS